MILTVDKTKDILLLGAANASVAALWIALGLPGWFSFFVVAWTTSVAVSLFLSSLRVPSKRKAVLITGCDTGFGFHLARRLHLLGFEVFACCLFADSKGEGADQLRREASDRLHVLQLNVTDQQQLNSVLQQVKNTLSPGRVLWGIVNNAGISAFGEVEWVALGDYQKVARVNLFGLISTTKTFLPLIKRAKGRIVNIASMLGRMTYPMTSPYVTSKFAVEGFSDCLRFEMRKLGVKVCIIEPGNFVAATKISTVEGMKHQAEEMWASMDKELQKDIGWESFNRGVNSAFMFEKFGTSDMTLVLDAMTDALTQRFPRPRYLPMEFYNFLILFMTNYLPEWVSDNFWHLVLKVMALWSRRVD